jgi:hypothetical protein
MNWNQVACHDCWDRNNPGREAVRMRGAFPMLKCSWCGKPTNSGIYVRTDPRTVPFPQPDDD